MRHRAGGDEGSALILALLVLVVVGVIMSSLLSFAGTGLVVAPEEKNQRNLSAYTQGSVEAAISRIRGSSTFGRTGRPCPDFSMPATSDTDSPGAGSHSYLVKCAGKSIGNVGQEDQPDYAILALGTAAGEGILQPQGGSNALLTIDGGIYSNRDITIEAGNGNSSNLMHVNGDAFAEGTCTSAPRLTTSDGQTFCNYNDTLGIGDDPQYAPAVNSRTALTDLISTTAADPTPTCANSERAEFTPGYYSVRPDTLLLNTKPNLSCRTTADVYHFAPGKYVFDFNGVWDLSSPNATEVIGGTLNSSWSPGDPLDTACLADQDGAQFIFGGSSRVLVKGNNSGAVVCGPRASQNFNSNQRIALYGLSSNANNGTWNRQDDRVTNGKVEATAAPTSPSPNPWTGIGNAQTLNETPVPLVATAALATVNSAHDTLQYGEFSDVPPGSTINSVTLRVGQQLVNTNGATVTLTTPTKPGGKDYKLQNDTCVPYCDVPVTLSDIAAGPEWKDINALTATYDVQGKSGSGVGAVAVDGMQLIVDYTPPALVATTCPGAGCLFFDSSVQPNVFFHGTVYVPTAAMSVNVHNTGTTIFDRGVVVRTITIRVSGSSKQETSPFQIPRATPFGRRVLFTAYRDGDLSAPWVRACVLFQDFVKFADGTSGGALPGYRAQVVHWSALRSPDVQDPDCT